MKSIPLRRYGVALMPVNIATVCGVEMKTIPFIVDTGATRTTINKKWLIADLGYTEDWVQKNRILIPEHRKPKMANGKRADVYEVPITRMTIGEHEIQPQNNVLTSDSVELSFLLGLDVLHYFRFAFDFDVTVGAPHGRLYYEFRASQRKAYTQYGEPFAYQLDDNTP